MSGALETGARAWLEDPAWLKNLKHTGDVIQDYLCYGLFVIGAIALSVRFLATLGTGDVACVILGVGNTSQQGELPFLKPTRNNI